MSLNLFVKSSTKKVLRNKLAIIDFSKKKVKKYVSKKYIVKYVYDANENSSSIVK